MTLPKGGLRYCGYLPPPSWSPPLPLVPKPHAFPKNHPFFTPLPDPQSEPKRGSKIRPRGHLEAFKTLLKKHPFFYTSFSAILGPRGTPRGVPKGSKIRPKASPNLLFTENLDFLKMSVSCTREAHFRGSRGFKITPKSVRDPPRTPSEAPPKFHAFFLHFFLAFGCFLTLPQGSKIAQEGVQKPSKKGQKK